MNRMQMLALGLGAILCITPVAHSQTPSAPKTDWPYDEIIARDDAFDHFKPADHGMTEILPEQLFGALTARDRCPEKAKLKEGIPCAFISYAPPMTNRKDGEKSLRPVFRVESENRIWTVWNGGLALVRIETLQRVHDLADPNAPDRIEYPAVAVLGVAENEKACNLGKACLDASYSQMQAIAVLTPKCIDEIWHKKPGPTGSAYQRLCRYITEKDK